MTYESKSQHGKTLAALNPDFKRIPETRVLGGSPRRLAAVLTMVMVQTS